MTLVLILKHFRQFISSCSVSLKIDRNPPVLLRFPIQFLLHRSRYGSITSTSSSLLSCTTHYCDRRKTYVVCGSRLAWLSLEALQPLCLTLCFSRFQNNRCPYHIILLDFNQSNNVRYWIQIVTFHMYFFHLRAALRFYIQIRVLSLAFSATARESCLRLRDQIQIP